MKKTKIIIPALGILLLSTAASVTGTVAWFSANTFVTADGMKVQAKAQNGIVISNAETGTYGPSATSAKTTAAQLLPGSTADLDTWLTSTSNDPAAPNTKQAYAAATAWADNEHDAHYVVHNFYIRSSAADELQIASLNVDSVVAKVGENNPTQDLSKALRVGVKFYGTGVTTPMIYAPVYTCADYTASKAAGAYAAGNMVAVNPYNTNEQSKDATITSLPNNVTAGLHAEVFVWFEGEDPNCISNNIKASLEEVSITVQFSYSPKA